MREKSEETVPRLEINYKNNETSGSSVCCSDNTSGMADSSSRTNVRQCNIVSSSKSADTRGDELRDEMITALAWASCRTFRYQPSDPIHYLAYQLLRWRHGDVSDRIAPITINSSNVHCNDARENKSSSVCSDNCKDTCIEQSSEGEISISQ